MFVCRRNRQRFDARDLTCVGNFLAVRIEERKTRARAFARDTWDAVVDVAEARGASVLDFGRYDCHAALVPS